VTTPGPFESRGVAPIFCAPGPPGGAATEKIFCVPGEAPGRYGKKSGKKMLLSTFAYKIWKKGPFFSAPRGREPLLQKLKSVSNFLTVR
jgi:hypothetical protein